MTIHPHVLFVNHSSKHAGAEIVLRDIAKTYNSQSAVWLFEDGPFKGLLEKEHVKVLLAKGSKDLSKINRKDNLLKTVLPLAGSLVSLVGQVKQASRNYDLLYANSQKAFIVASIAAKLAKKPIIWHLHDILSREHFSNTQIKLDIFLANAIAARVIVPSHATADAFIAAGGNKSLIDVVHNGASFPITQTSDYEKYEIRKKLGLPSCFLYGVFSRLSSWKGQHVAIKALEHIQDAKCVIVGDAQFSETEYKQSLYDLVDELNLKDRVIFMGHRNDVQEIMRCMDVYCHPSTSPEPFSLAILEAMSCKLPIVAANTGGIPEAIMHNTTGLLFQSGNIQKLAQSINSIKSDHSFGEKLGNKAQLKVEKDFTINRMQENVRNIIERTLNR